MARYRRQIPRPETAAGTLPPPACQLRPSAAVIESQRRAAFSHGEHISRATQRHDRPAASSRPSQTVRQEGQNDTSPPSRLLSPTPASTRYPARRANTVLRQALSVTAASSRRHSFPPEETAGENDRRHIYTGDTGYRPTTTVMSADCTNATVASSLRLRPT